MTSVGASSTKNLRSTKRDAVGRRFRLIRVGLAFTVVVPAKATLPPAPAAAR